MKLIMEFDETGGYDCMTGAWIIRHADTLDVFMEIDQANFGQIPCEYDYRSAEAERVARIVLAALEVA